MEREKGELKGEIGRLRDSVVSIGGEPDSMGNLISRNGSVVVVNPSVHPSKSIQSIGSSSSAADFKSLPDHHESDEASAQRADEAEKRLIEAEKKASDLKATKE